MKGSIQEKQCIVVALLLAFCCGQGSALAQQQRNALLRGTVRDENGGAIAGASVMASCAGRAAVTATSATDGNYSLALPRGASCILHASAQSFAQSNDIERTTTAADSVDFTLKIETVTSDVIVNADDEALISIDPESNAGAMILRAADMDSLPDDPDDLLEDLLAMAGPSASGGVQLYTDGFTGQKLPPKAAIREIRINQNPYSAEFDHVGLGRIEILTKPGTNPIHGSLEYRASDALFDSRNPFAATQAPYRAQLVTASVGGPATQKLS